MDYDPLRSIPVNDRLRAVVWIWFLLPFATLLSNLWWVIHHPTPVERENFVFAVALCAVAWLCAAGLARRKWWAWLGTYIQAWISFYLAALYLFGMDVYSVTLWPHLMHSALLAATGAVINSHAVRAEFPRRNRKSTVKKSESQ